MKYSRWRPDTGGYDYFEAADRFGLGDDLPVPKLFGGTDIGVASTDIGRNPSSGTRPAGSGRTPQGSIMPLSRAGLSGIPGGALADVLFIGAMAAVVAAPAAAGGYVAASALGKNKKKWALYGAIAAPVALFGWNLIAKRLVR